MSDRLAEGGLARMGAFIAGCMGLHFPPGRWRDLERGLRAAAREFEFEEIDAFLQWLTQAPLSASQIGILAGHLTVGETYFLREPRSFEALKERVFPALLAARRNQDRRLRIWSAGCCTGEEPYSIAMLVSRMIDLEEWKVTILGTDINPRFLKKAVEGVYGKWSFRDAPAWLREGYFRETAAGHFEVLPRIREMVSFAYLNLVEDTYPSLENGTNAMDVIFCRNVLMYLAPERARQVIEGFHRSLVDGGWLVVSPTEASSHLFAEFTPFHFPGAIFYQKGRQKVEPALPLAVPWALPAPIFRPESAPALRFETVRAPLPVELPAESVAEEPKRAPYEEAEALYAQGEYAAAVEKLEGMVAADPGGIDGALPDGKAIVLLVRSCANQGRLTEALSWCEQAAANDRLNPSYPYLRAILLQEQERLDEAAGALRQALYLDAGLAMAHFALGHLRRRQGKPRAAKKHFENALECAAARPPEEALPESEGLTAGRLAEVIRSTIEEVSP